MLTRNQLQKKVFTGGRYVIVASEYNKRYVDGMLKSAKAVLKRSRASQVVVYRVPGAFEIPVVVAELLAGNQKDLSAILTLGVVIQGETEHARHIGDTVSQLMGSLSVKHRVPIIFEVLLLNDKEQARQRCLGKDFNKGAEAALTAIQMAHLMGKLRAGQAPR